MPLKDDRDRVHIRIKGRTTQETLLIWNTDSLTEEQREHFKVEIRSLMDNKWVSPKIVKPDPNVLQLEPNHDAIYIRHGDGLYADTPFLARIRFGISEIREEAVRVAGSNSSLPYVKPIRTASGVYALPIDWPNLPLIKVVVGGREIMALPVVIVGDQSGMSTVVDQVSSSESLTKKEE